VAQGQGVCHGDKGLNGINVTDTLAFESDAVSQCRALTSGEQRQGRQIKRGQRCEQSCKNARIRTLEIRFQCCCKHILWYAYATHARNLGNTRGNSEQNRT
jgi:hypothetical protein